MAVQQKTRLFSLNRPWHGVTLLGLIVCFAILVGAMQLSITGQAVPV